MSETAARDQRSADAERPEHATDGGPAGAVDEATRRSQFLYCMGHTLRTPLNAILGYSELLTEEVAGPLTERQKTYVRRIAEAGERQLAIVDNLVLLARFHAGEITPALEPIDIGGLLGTVADALRPRASERGHTLECHLCAESAVVRGDPSYLERAFHEVIANAVLFTEDPGAVSVTLSLGRGPADEVGDRWATVSVVDTGPGIPVEHRSHVLDDLGDARAMAFRRAGRTGLGLPLSRRIVDMHGGQIVVGDVSGGDAAGGNTGARVSIMLPLSASG